MTTSRLRARFVLGALAVALALTLVLRLRPVPVPAAESSRAAAAGASVPAGAEPPALPASERGEAFAAPASKSPALLAALRTDALAQVQAFDDWLTAWRRADSAARPSLAGTGRDLALARRAAIKHLIETDPRLALEHAIPAGLRTELPDAVRDLLEQRIDARGDIDVQVACGVQGTRIDRIAVIDGKRFAVATFGRRAQQLTKLGVPLHGVAVDGVMALSDLPYRLLDDGEKSERGLAFDVTAAAVGDEVRTLAGATELDALAQELVALEAVPGPHVARASVSVDPAGPGMAAVTSPPSWINGDKRVLWVKADFSDSPGAVATDDQIAATNTAVSEFYRNNSQGKTTMTFTTLPAVLRLPRDKAYYNGFATSDDELAEAAKTLAKQYDVANGGTGTYDPDRYDRWIVLFSKIAIHTFAGRAQLGGPRIKMHGTISPGTVSHEIGHTQSLDHAHFWLPSGASAIGGGAHVEYGDVFDAMGSSGSSANNHFNAPQKAKLGYLDEASITTVTESGTYRVARHDHRDAAGVRGLKIMGGGLDYDYWVEHRRSGPDSFSGVQLDRLRSGALLHWGPGRTPKFTTGAGSYLVDATPGSAGGVSDAPLRAGETFIDPDAGVTIKSLLSGGSAPGEYLDIQVAFGAIDGNRNPTLQAEAPTGTLRARTNLIFAASGGDPDGDPVYFRWNFGDGTVEPTVGNITRRFAKGGNYTLRVSSHDGKGGIASRSLPLTVVDPLLDWTQRGASATSNPLYGVVFGAGKFVAAGDNSTVLTSPDGLAWRAITTPGNNNFYRGVAHNGARFVAVGLGPNATQRGGAVFSDDGETWSAGTLPANVGTMSAVAAGAGVFVAVGETGRIYYSADGTAWNEASSPVTTALITITYANGLFVVGGSSGRILTSSDGIDWTNRSVSTGNTLASIAYHQGAWYASSATLECFTSPNGVAWTRIVTAGRTNNTLRLASTSGVLFAATANGSIALTEQPRNWVTHQITSAASTTFYGIAEGRNMLVVVGSRGLVYTAATATPSAPPVPAPVLRAEGDSLKVSVGKKNIVSASGGGFAKLELYANGIKVSEINGAAGAFSWTPSAIGPYSLVVRGVAASGESAVSATYAARAGVARWNWRNPSPVGADLNGAVRADGKWWLVGRTGALLTLSDDGTFERVDFPTTQHLTGITYANGQFVVSANYFDSASGEDIGPIWTSTDGYNWNLATATTLAGLNINFITYAQDKWLIGSLGSVIVTSPDGVNWTRQITGLANPMRGAAYGGSLWVAVAAGGKIITSPDAVRWTERTSGVTTDLAGVAYNNGAFVIAGLSGVILRSTDGVNWARQTSGTNSALNGVGVVGGSFVIAGDTGVTLFSPEGTAWTRSSMEGKFSSSLAIATAAERAVMVGRAGEVYTSNHPGAWQRVTTGSGAGLSSVIFASGRFVTVGLRTDPITNVVSTAISHSADGVRWTRANSSTGLNAVNFFGVAHALNTYVAVGDGGRIFTSTNAADWTAQISGVTTSLTSVAGGPAGFVAAGTGGVILSSADGVAWSTRPSGTTNTFNSVGFGDGRFVAVGGSGTIQISTDGVTWTSVESGVTATLNVVRWFENVGYLIGGNSGTMLKSTDGANWQQVETNITTFISTLAQTPIGLLAGVGVSGGLLVSLDGSSWTNATYPADRQMNSMVATSSTIVAVGTSGAMVAFDFVDATPAPVIAAAPTPQVAVAGGLAIFTAGVQNAGGAVYQWLKDGQPIPGANGPVLTITNVTDASLGRYAVVVTTPTGIVTSTDATLAIAAANQAGRLVNLSLLTALSAADNGTFTMGAVVGGSGTSGTKPLLVRAVGPALAAFSVANPLRDPALEFFTGTTRIGENDNWGGSAALRTAFASVGAFAFADGASLDAAIYNSAVALGNNSIRVSGVGGATGGVLAELYDATPNDAFTATTPRLINVSVLKHIGTGMTAGFVIGGSTPRRILVRAIGPTLGAAPFNVPGVVADPQLALFAGSSQVGENNNWGGTAVLSAAFAQLAAFALPNDSRDAALLVELQPGSYTVQVSGVAGSTGVALVEIYEVP